MAKNSGTKTELDDEDEANKKPDPVKGVKRKSFNEVETSNFGTRRSKRAKG